MQFITLGFNHKTAPLAIRDNVAFAPEIIAPALHELTETQAANEIVILSTCNRTELYSVGAPATRLLEWLSKKQALSPRTLTPHLYTYENMAAVRHLMRVVCGLDSMVLGEPEIFGQVKSAFAVAQQVGTIGQQLGRLFPAAFAVGKQVRRKTGIGDHPISMAYATLNLAQKIFTRVQNCTVLLLGAGKTIELVATHFFDKGIAKLIIGNRSLERGSLLANAFQAQAIALSEINTVLPSVDIVITATASPVPLLGKGAVETALKMRKHKPILMIDLAVPRNIEPEISRLEDVYLYNIDDLQSIINENMKNRTMAAHQAELLIEVEVQRFMREIKALAANDIIRTYREQVESITAKQLTLALQQLEQGKSPELLLQKLAHNLTQKILHQPTVRIRQAAEANELELLLLAKRLFDINE